MFGLAAGLSARFIRHHCRFPGKGRITRNSRASQAGMVSRASRVSLNELGFRCCESLVDRLLAGVPTLPSRTGGATAFVFVDQILKCCSYE